MSKILAVMIAGLFAAGAYAQQTNVQTDSKPQQRAEMKKDARPAGEVKKPMGDSANNQEMTAAPADKSNMAGERRKQTRDARRGKKPLNPQGGTPQ